MHPGSAFLVRGTINGTPATARWTDHQLDADAEVLERVDLIASVGLEHARPDGRALRLGLDDGPIAALLAVLRSFDDIREVELSVDLYLEEQGDVMS